MGYRPPWAIHIPEKEMRQHEAGAQIEGDLWFPENLLLAKTPLDVWGFYYTLAQHFQKRNTT